LPASENLHKTGSRDPFFNPALADPKMKARFADLGGIAFPGSPADLGKFIEEQTEKWGKVIRAANIKAE
jgi:tripartite-type tricarboxylate transporter receptor subunit TctC